MRGFILLEEDFQHQRFAATIDLFYSSCSILFILSTIASFQVPEPRRKPTAFQRFLSVDTVAEANSTIFTLFASAGTSSDLELCLSVRLSPLLHADSLALHG